MSAYTEFFLNSQSSVVQLELLRITHPSFSQAYNIVRNATAGVTVSGLGLDGLDTAAFTYYPLRIRGAGSRENLDYGLNIDLGDLGELLPQELDRVATDASYGTLPAVHYWTYRSDDLTAPLFGPITLEAKNISFTREGATIEAKAPSLNVNRTGERYTTTRFPMLRGFL